MRVGNFTKKQPIQKPKLNVSVVQVKVNCESAIVMGRGVERKCLVGYKIDHMLLLSR